MIPDVVGRVPEVAGMIPESGNIRGIFIDESEPTGTFSPSYPIVVS